MVELVIVQINKNQNYQTGISHPDSSPNAAGLRLLAICYGQTSLHWPLLPRSTWRPPRAAWTPPCQWPRCCQCPLAWGNIITFLIFYCQDVLPDEPHRLPLGQVAPDLGDEHHHLLQGDRPAVVIIKHGKSLNKFLGINHCWWDQKRRLWYAERRGDTVR